MDTKYICTVYFEKQTPCQGGVLALNGKTGDVIWTHWTAYSIFSVDCGVDLTHDEIKDCVISGRGGILQAIDGRDGSNLWEMPLQDSSEPQITLDVYDARFIADMDDDGTGDVIASHAVQSDNTQTSNILVISGRSGDVIRNIDLPDTEQLFVAPQIIIHPDGENIFVLATTSQQDDGGLYIVSQANIFYGDLKLQKINRNNGKNALLAPILIDITSDGIADIVAAMFNSTIVAYNGATFEPIWEYKIPNSEVISIPIPGYYNDDDIPDFMVKHQIGTGSSTYYYTLATVLDGRNGLPLLEKPMEDSLSGQMSGLSITVDGFGNDWFLHWSTDCLNYEGVKDKYQFLKDQSFMSQTNADLCFLKFNSTLTTRLLALSQHVGPPGLPLYISEKWKSLEFNNSADTQKEKKYSNSRLKIADTYVNAPLVSERSPEVHKNHRKDRIFKHKDSNILEIGKYDLDAVYENIDELKSHKKHNPEDTVDNLDVDQPWKQDKWMDDDTQSDKEYGSIYESDNANEDEQSVDYSQGEVREQRSVTVDNDLSTMNISNKEDFLKEAGNYSTSESSQYDLQFDHNNKNSSVNNSDITITTLKSEEKLSTTLSDESNIETTTAIHNLLNTSESIKVRSTNSSMELSEDAHTEAVNVTTNQIITSRQEKAPVKKVGNATQRRQIYKHSFPSIIQNADDDASIEKVFKRESLKNQSRGKINKNQLRILSLITDKDFKMRLKRRAKRNSGTDNGQSNGVNGVQKQAPTGILLPSITESKGKTSIDLVFSTFWLPSPEVSLILISDQVDQCIHKKQALFQNKFEYKKDDDIINECLSERGVNYRWYQESKDRENNKVALGQMTIYRMKLECVCPEDMLPNQTCRNISSHQSWPEYLGSLGNGYFKPLGRSNV
ncbi:hypothetical protein PUN28_008647 [Cardiocondyla obscurior]